MTAPSLAPAKTPIGNTAIPSPRALKPAGKALTIEFSGESFVVLRPYELQIVGKVGCAITLSQDGVRDQMVVAIGEGETEALTCGELKAAGRVPAPSGMERIALFYKTYALHAEVLQPVILSRPTSSAVWLVDDALAQQISEDESLKTIPLVRQWLKNSMRR